jgi:hypothetical protein
MTHALPFVAALLLPLQAVLYAADANQERRGPYRAEGE